MGDLQALVLENLCQTDKIGEMLAHSIVDSLPWDKTLQMPSKQPAAKIISLTGQLGTGKTTLVRSVLRHLGCTEVVPSPTFPIVETYELEEINVWHIDCYRLTTAAELHQLGFDEFLNDAKGLGFIEWPKHILSEITTEDIALRLDHIASGEESESRAFNAYAKTEWGKNQLDTIAENTASISQY